MYIYVRLPHGLWPLYHLASLGKETLLQEIEKGTIHPTLTLRQIKELVARLKGLRQNSGTRKVALRRTKNFSRFVLDILGTLSPEERGQVAAMLVELLERVRTNGTGEANDGTSDGSVSEGAQSPLPVDGG